MSRQCDFVGRPESRNRNRYMDVCWHFKAIQQPVQEQLDIMGARALIPTFYHTQKLIWDRLQAKSKATHCRAFRRKQGNISTPSHYAKISWIGHRKHKKEKKKVTKLDWKLRSFSYQKTALRKWEDDPWVKRKFSQYLSLTKDLYPEYVRNFYSSLIKRQATQLKKMSKTLE